MANIYSYWDDTTKYLSHFSHNALSNKGNRVEIILDSSDDVFSVDDPHGDYQLNDSGDGVELKP